jgi:hypothetical protein
MNKRDTPTSAAKAGDHKAGAVKCGGDVPATLVPAAVAELTKNKT